jgi:hypothetical protein
MFSPLAKSLLRVLMGIVIATIIVSQIMNYRDTTRTHEEIKHKLEYIKMENIGSFLVFNNRNIDKQGAYGDVKYVLNKDNVFLYSTTFPEIEIKIDKTNIYHKANKQWILRVENYCTPNVNVHWGASSPSQNAISRLTIVGVHGENRLGSSR